MLTKTILIEGHKAVPIPDPVLAQCALGESVDVSVVPGGVLVKPVGRKVREGWAEALQAVPVASLDQDFEDLRAVREIPATFDAVEW